MPRWAVAASADISRVTLSISGVRVLDDVPSPSSISLQNVKEPSQIVHQLQFNVVQLGRQKILEKPTLVLNIDYREEQRVLYKEQTKKLAARKSRP